MNYPYASLNLEADRAMKAAIQIFRTDSEGPLDDLSLPNAENASVTNEQKEAGKESNSPQKQTGLRDTNDLRLSSYCSELNRLLRELVFLSWFAQQKKERRRLVIASLESLMPVSDCGLGLPAKHAKLRENRAKKGKQKNGLVLKCSFQKAAELCSDVDGRTMGEPPGDGTGSDRNTGVKFGEASGLTAGSVSFAGLNDTVG
jgi:hypothetical protein